MPYTALSAISAAARVYLRPNCFIDTPSTLDGRVARMGNSLIWYHGYEFIVMQDGQRVFHDLVTLDWIEDALFALPDRQQAETRALIDRIALARAPLRLGERVIRFDAPQVMGVLNMTPDSFSDGGKHLNDPSAATDAAFAMYEAGAAMIDVGGESTRPGAEKTWEGDEIKRIVPVIEQLAKAGVPVSVDTRKATVMEAALAAGAHLINDISGLLHDPRSVEVVAKANCPVVLMHAPSSGDNPHAGAAYAHAVIDVYDWLEKRVEDAVAAGVERENIIVDPGIGFGKSLQHNLSICSRLALFQGLGAPVLFGASRKRMIGALSNEAPVGERLGGSVALAFHAVQMGAQMVRVHDVKETVQAVHLWRGMRDAAIMMR